MSKKVKISNTINQPQRLKALSSNKDWWDDLSEFQKQEINAGLDDIKHGRVLSSDEFWKQLKNE